MEIRHYAITGTELRAADGDKSPTIMKGYASVFDSASHDLGNFREFVKRGAFTRSLASSQNGNPNDNIFALWSHRDDQPLGSIQGGKLKLSEDERGLYFELDVSRMTPAQLDAAKDGELRMSFGFSVREQEWKLLDDGSEERTLIDVDLFEVSPVINPAYPDTTAAIRSLRSWRATRDAPTEVETPEIVDEIKSPEVVGGEAFEAVKLRLLKRWAERNCRPTE